MLHHFLEIFTLINLNVLHFANIIKKTFSLLNIHGCSQFYLRNHSFQQLHPIFTFYAKYSLHNLYSNLFITSRERWRNFIFTPRSRTNRCVITDVHPLSRIRRIFSLARESERMERGGERGKGISSSRHICREGGNTWEKFARILRAEGIIPDGARRGRDAHSLSLSLSLTSKYRGPDLGISKCEGRGRGRGLHDKFPAFAFKANTRKEEWMIGIGGKVFP